MPKYDIQFQEGLSLSGFLGAYGTEAKCMKAIFKASWPRGSECPKCGSMRFCRLSPVVPRRRNESIHKDGYAKGPRA